MWQPVTDKHCWNELVAAQEHSQFLQSWQWGEFQESFGRIVLRLSYGSELLVQAIHMPLFGPFFYWYIPHGPILLREHTGNFRALMELEQKLSEQGALFFRVDPVQRISPSSEQEERNRNGRMMRFVPATQPQCTRILDLFKPEDELLQAMHSKTRYNIKVAEKKGVSVHAGTIENFLKLYRQTVERDKFKQNPDSWLVAMARRLDAQSGASIKIWEASYNATPVAASMTAYFGDTVTYLHGASANEYRNTMAPYLLHWEIVRHAKKAGYHYYDFRGVNPDEPTHAAYKKSWEGITRFKSGFGGAVACYPHSFDLIYKPWWYRVYRLARIARRFV